MTHLYKRVGRYLVVALATLAISTQASALNTSARRKKKSSRNPEWTTVEGQSTQDEVGSGDSYEELKELIASLIKKGEKLIGKPYRATGIAPWALDCSGYVSYLYKQLGFTIPRSSAALSTYTERVDQPKAGDLLFFKGRNASASRVGHVALVVANEDGDPVIMHSTNSKGIVKHRLSKVAYFSKRYLFAGRLPEIADLFNKAQESNKD